MKIAVFSDSHGPIDGIRQGLKELPEVDQLLFAGDGIRNLVDSNLARELKIAAVKGNRDQGIEFPEEKVVELAGRKFLVTHGDDYGVQWGLDKLDYRARELGVEVVIFGHTHRRYANQKNGILFFNPGSITSPRDQLPPSYGLIEIKEGKMNYTHYEVNV